MLHRNYQFKHQKIISDKLLSMVNENNYNTYGVYHPKNSYDFLCSIDEFVEDAKETGIWSYIRGFSINVIDPQSNNFVHIDPWFDTFSRYRFIFPIQNTTNTSVAFYKSEFEPDETVYIKNDLDSEKTFRYFKNIDGKLLEIDRVSTEVPAVIDTQTLHSAQNPNDSIRIIAMIGLRDTYDIKHT